VKRPRNRTGDLLFADSVPSDTGGLLKTGIFSLLFHIGLIIFLVLNLKSAIPKNRSNVYWVSIRPCSSIPFSLPERTQIQKAKNKLMSEAREVRPLVKEKDQGQVSSLPAQPVVAGVHQEDQKQLLGPEKEEEEVEGPIPLPMGEGLSLSARASEKTGEDLTISFGASTSGEQQVSGLLSAGRGGGPGTSPGGGGKGIGLDRGAGLEETSGVGQGGFGLRVTHGAGSGGEPNRGSPRDGAGEGKGSSGRGAGDGLGPGQTGFSRGISAKEVTGGPLPRYAKNPKPLYPQVARERGYEGEVLLRVEVLSDGGVGQIEIRKSSGYDVLDQSALTTVKQWKFIPARNGDVPVAFWINIPIKFRLL
jgi:TonB family protein